MMRQYELVERVASYIDNPNEDLLNRAYVYAMQKHGEQKRASGDPYFSHPLEVAAILTDLYLDEETIAVALLHDTIEDTDATRREIDELFGPTIGKLVEGLTKLKKLDLVSNKAKQAENLRRLLLAISDDVRVLLVKLADRLHNMRTMGAMRPDKQKRIATETLEIYAPLARRMGMQDLREELEELSFQYVFPEPYEAVTKQMAELGEKNTRLSEEISQSLQDKFSQMNIKAEVKSRQKKPYSVFRKMQSKSLSFEQLSDIYGFRVIVDKVDECYSVLGIVHTAWAMVPGRFKDFISLPKQNDYQSIHTTIVGPSHQRVELQIRTQEMDRVAEYGIAAHAGYKDGEDFYAESNAYISLRKTIDQLNEADSPEDFLEHTKLELFLDQVFCFSPKGKIISLPKGATPIDFAYAVHTDIGNSCIGCKLNGKIMPVITELSNGDEVEIIRSDEQSPPSAWESVVTTGKARSAIRKASRLAFNKQYSTLGKRMVERVFEQENLIFDVNDLERVLSRLARKRVVDVLSDVGRGDIDASDVLKAIHSDYEAKENANQKTVEIEQPFGEISNKSIPIRGLNSDLPVKFSKEGGAVPGDKIVGILEPGVGITIYANESKTLAQYEGSKDNLLDLRWDLDPQNSERLSARISVLAINAPGTLAVISSVIANAECNIQNIAMSTPDTDFTQMDIDIDVWDLAHLTQIIEQLKSKDVITNVERIIG